MDRITSLRDEAILEALISNARIPKTELARMINVTEAAVRKRLKKLEELGVILGYRAIIDYQKAGLIASITGLDVEPEKLWRVIGALKEMREVKTILLTSGDHMIIAEIVAKNVSKLEEVHRRIGEVEGVRRMCPAIVLRNVK